METRVTTFRIQYMTHAAAYASDICNEVVGIVENDLSLDFNGRYQTTPSQLDERLELK
ncbi:hypothetical protein KZ483_09960 [Paenibacillus sp. sptzw28]|uniref:hypothetical protein n=1 Tax=Paenibacillus sp. sptzw28 TaxID=715179 RepID=UPI001C6E1563|nr:hypothetical protein [Paenibacillus sp. sptzw28]QYR23207.1 hypothetical protein KZ483_09960 [Paenibacillus sp. sptzw28]